MKIIFINTIENDTSYSIPAFFKGEPGTVDPADLAAIEQYSETAQSAAESLGATPYPTKANMDAVTGTANAKAYVYNDTLITNNGLYIWNGTWIKDRSNVASRLQQIESDLNEVDNVKNTVGKLDTTSDEPLVIAAVAETDDPEIFMRTWLEVTELEGGPSQWSAELIFKALQKYGIGGTPQKVTDTTKIVAWGASDMRRLIPGLQTMATGFGVQLVDRTKQNTWMHQQWANQGSRPAIVRFPNNTVPGNSSEVAVEWLNNVSSTSNLAPFIVAVGKTGAIGQFRDGTFSRRQVVNGFTQPVVLEGPVELYPVETVEEADCVQIWSNGFGNLLNQSNIVTEYISLIQNAYDKHPTVDKKVLILGSWIPQSLSDARATQIDQANAQLRIKFGERYIDQKAYLTGSSIWTHTGITPTSADTAAQALGRNPPSLMEDASHVNAVTATAIVNNLIRPRLVALGWY